MKGVRSTPPLGAENPCKRGQRTNLFRLCQVQPNLEKLKKTLRVFYGGLNNDGRAAHARIIFNFKFFISNYNMYLCSRFFAKGISCFAVESIILNLTRMP